MIYFQVEELGPSLGQARSNAFELSVASSHPGSTFLQSPSSLLGPKSLSYSLRSSMGVLGLAPFLAKYAPQSITPYGSLSSFANKTVAIDANLLTTRFHFTPTSPEALRSSGLTPEVYEENKCVRSWYHFLMALKREGIKPVVLFDGSTRSKAKNLELIKRTASRNLMEMRGELEGAREARRRDLREWLEAGSVEDRAGVAMMLKDRIARNEIDDGELVSNPSDIDSSSLEAFTADSTSSVMLEAFEQGDFDCPVGLPQGIGEDAADTIIGDGDLHYVLPASNLKQSVASSPGLIQDFEGQGAEVDRLEDGKSKLEELTLDDSLTLEELPLNDLTLDELTLDDRLEDRNLALDEFTLDDLTLEELPLNELPLNELPLNELMLDELTLDELKGCFSNAEALLVPRKQKEVENFPLKSEYPSESKSMKANWCSTEELNLVAKQLETIPSLDLIIDSPIFDDLFYAIYDALQDKIADLEGLDGARLMTRYIFTMVPSSSGFGIVFLHSGTGDKNTNVLKGVPGENGVGFRITEILGQKISTSVPQETRVDLLHDRNVESTIQPVALGDRQRSLLALEDLHKSFLEDSSHQLNSPRQKALALETADLFQGILESGSDGIADTLTKNLTKLVDQSEKLALDYQKAGAGVPSHAYDDTLTLIKALGVPFYRPPFAEPVEAEGLCCSLYLKGLVDYVVTEDSDVTVYGAPLLRKIVIAEGPMITTGVNSNVEANLQTVSEASEIPEEIEGSKKQRTSSVCKEMHVIDPVKVRDELGMTKEMFVDFALLCGTDFTRRIPRCGPITALKLIRKHNSIEEILSSQTKFLPPDLNYYLTSVQIARQIFLHPPELPGFFSMEDRLPDPCLNSFLELWGIVPEKLEGVALDHESKSEQELDNLEDYHSTLAFDEKVEVPRKADAEGM